MQPADQPSECTVVATEAITLAVATDSVSLNEIPRRIIPLFDRVYGWIKGAAIRQVGHNYAMYQQLESGMKLSAGFPVSSAFESTPAIQCVEIAPGWAAHTVHHGPYSGLGETHHRLRQWCETHGIAMQNHAWEVYSDHHRDESQLSTDVYLRLLAPPPGLGCL